MRPVPAVLWLAGVLSWLTAACLAQGAEPDRSITVSARADIKVVPDRVLLTLSVRSEHDKDLLAAKADNDNRTRAVLALAEKYGIPEKHFLIDSIDMGPQYERMVLVGYRVDRDIEITLDDFNFLEPVLSDALAAGATGVHGILFVTTKHREQQFEARKLAVEHAKEKASHLAELNGLKLGKAIRIEESVEGDHHTEGFGFGGAMGMSGAADHPGKAKVHFVAADQPVTKESEKQPGAAPRKPIAPGQLTISATVTITFALTE